MTEKRNFKKCSSSENSDEELQINENSSESEKCLMGTGAFDEYVPGSSSENSDDIFYGNPQANKQQQIYEIEEIASVSPQDENDGSQSDSLENVSIIYEFPEEDFSYSDFSEDCNSIEQSSHKDDEPETTELIDQGMNDSVFQLEEEADIISSESNSTSSDLYEDELDNQIDLKIIVHSHAMGFAPPEGSTCCSSSDNLADVEDNLECSSSVLESPNMLAGNRSNAAVNITACSGISIGFSKPELTGLTTEEENKTQKPSEEYTPIDWMDSIQILDPAPMTSTNHEWDRSEDSVGINERKIRSGVARNKKRQCGVCKKKLDLTAITCRCGGLFCAKHRYDREHGCTFDYKSMGAEKIRKENPKITAEKVTKF